jgi:hypothetical protein
MQETLNKAVLECPKSVETPEFNPQVGLGLLTQMYEEHPYWESNIDLELASEALSFT